jgi:hypothetical protein
MLNVLGESYFVDLDEIENYLDIREIESDITGGTESRVNIIKFEMVKMLMEVLLTENPDMDDKLGMKSKEVSIPFKIAFNTLLNKKLINHY